MKRGIVTNAVDWRSRKLQGSLNFQGLSISIENERGTYRQGTDDHGKVWRTFMHIPYGYVKGTEGVDGDHVDVYVGPDHHCSKVFIVHQNDPYTGKYDEDKCMLGFHTGAEAKAAYLRQYDRPDYFGSMLEIDIATFKAMLKEKKGLKLKKSMDDKHGFLVAMESATVENDNFRKVLFTGPHAQLVLMSLKPGENIGMEVHKTLDQFIRADGGSGIASIGGKAYKLTDGSAIIVPAGAKHDIRAGKDGLKLYAVYTETNHPDDVIDETKADAEEREGLEKAKGRTGLVPVERQVMRSGKVFTMRFWVSRDEAKKIHEKRKTVPMGKEKRKPFGSRKRRDTAFIMREDAIKYSPAGSRQVDRSLKLQYKLFPEGPGTGAETDEILKTASTEISLIKEKEAKGEYFGRDWYTDKMVQARATLSEIYPELTGDEAWGQLAVIVAVTSPGMDPASNLDVALPLYESYRETGKVPLTQPDGTMWPGKNTYKMLQDFNALSKKLGGPTEFMAWMKGNSTGAEIRDVKPNFTGKLTETYPNSTVFGPKVGVFFRNLLGESEHLTIDRWAARSFYRWSNKINPMLNSLGAWEAVVTLSAGEREEMKYVIDVLAKENNMTVSEVQAVMWYYEKRLYKAMGTIDAVEGIDYEQAAQRAYDRYLSERDGGDGLQASA